MTYKLIFVNLLIFSQIIFSQSLQDMQKLRSEYEKMKRQESAIPSVNENIPLNDIEENVDPRMIRISPYTEQIKIDSLEDDRYFFGYDFFVKRDTVGFWENLSIPQNYLLGPGDELIVSLWGETSLRQSYTISRSGKIYDEKVGILNISGLTIDEAKVFLLRQFGSIYSTLGGQKPSTFIDVSLGALKSINVNFVGEVNYPGVYAVHPFSNAITGLIQAGGVDTTGSLRSIVIKRNNKIFKEIDLYDYLLKGNISNDIQLKDQDIILVKIRNSLIEIDSSVYKPGVYESLKGETVKDLIDFAGGLKPDASGVINVKRINRPDRKNRKNATNKNYYINYEDSKEALVNNGDRLFAEKMILSLQSVEMIGQVKNPGIYSYFDGMTLEDLVELGAGFEDTTFWKSIYQNQAEIVRREPSSRYEKVIKINLGKLKNENNFSSVKLQNLDRFVVHSNLNFFEKKNIQINGEVNIPGSYPLTTDNESLLSLIQRAGGLTNKALDNGISIYRDRNYFENNYNISDDSEKVRVAWKSNKIQLMPGDSIIIKEKTGTINVIGEVYNPGLIEFKNGKSIRSYINDAGGLTESGNRKGVVLVYANGVVVPRRWYNSPRVLDGSTIIVNTKEQTEPFDVTQFATNWTQIVSSLVTAFVLSQQISNSN